MKDTCSSRFYCRILALAALAALAARPPGLAQTPHNLRSFMEAGPNAATFNAQGLTGNHLLQQALVDGAVPIIIKMRADSGIPKAAESVAAEVERRAVIAVAQERLLNELALFRVDSVKKYSFIPYMAMTVDPGTLEYLMHSDQVEGIYEDGVSIVQMAESVPLIGAPAMWNLGYTGSGVAVALLDTGADKTHPFLSGRVISEACYSSNVPAEAASSLCPGGVEVSTETDSGMPCTGISGCEHGTKVAGIISGSQPAFSGVAKNAGLISIKVMSRFNSSSRCGGAAPCLAAYWSDQIAGLQRVYDLRNTYKIAAVNMSLSDNDSWTANCNSDVRKAAIDQLRSAGIATVIAVGNGNYQIGISAPACISTAISVGASGDGSGGGTLDQERPFSNSAAIMTFLAPGSVITGPIPFWYDPSGYISGYGTSYCTAHVSGAWALLKQASPNASVEQIKSALENTGVMIPIRAGGTKPRISIWNAAVSMGVTSPPPKMTFLPFVFKN